MLKLDFNLLFTVINLLVLYILMKKLLFDKLNAILKKRKDLMDQHYIDAIMNRDNARKLRDEYDAALKSAKYVSDQIIADAKLNAKAEFEKIVKQADEEAERIFEKSKKNIEWENVKSLHKMKADIAEIAMDIASKVVSKNSTSKSDQKLYDQFLEEMGELDGTNSN